MNDDAKKQARTDELEQVSGGVPVPGHTGLDAAGNADALRDQATLPHENDNSNDSRTNRRSSEPLASIKRLAKSTATARTKRSFNRAIA